VHSAAKPWWQQATALVTVSTGGMITGFTFAPGAAAAMTSPTGVPVHLMALEKAATTAHSGDAALSSDSALRSAVVNVAKYYLQLAKTRTPAQMEALIWGKDSLDGADHGQSCAAFASLTLELGAQAVGQQSWVTGGSTYPWPVHEWADSRVDPNPDSPSITSVLTDAQAHGRWHPLGDGYQPQPGDWVMFDQHAEVVTGYSNGVLDTIGADSLPGYTVNAHTFSGSLSEYGIAGFVDNGHLATAASATGNGTSSQSPTQQHAAERQSTGQGQHGQQSQTGQRSQGSQGNQQSETGQQSQSSQNGQRGQQPAARQQPGSAAIPGMAAPQPAAAHASGSAANAASAPSADPRLPGVQAPAAQTHPAQARATPAASIPGLIVSGDSDASGGSGATGGGAASKGAATSQGSGASHGSSSPGESTSKGASGASAPGQSSTSGPPADSAVIPGLAPLGGSAPAAQGGTSPKVSGQNGSAGGKYTQHTPDSSAPTPATKAQQAFISSVAPGAMAAQQRYGVPASVTIAQAIEESAWGTSKLATADHNLFGIKGDGPAGSAYYPTQEYVGGHWETITAAFRAYHNIAESISDHAELIATSGYYTRAMADRSVPDAFANDLTGVYATDPDYGSNLIATMKLYDLYRYDTTAPSASQQAAPSAPAAPHTAPAQHATTSQQPTEQHTTAPAATPSHTAVPTHPAAPAPAPSATPTPVPSHTATLTSPSEASVPGIPTSPPAAPRSTAAPSASATQSASASRTPSYQRAPSSQNAQPAKTKASAKSTPSYQRAPSYSGAAPRGGANIPGLVTTMIPAKTAARYTTELPPAVATAYFTSAKMPLARTEQLYRDVASQAGISWKLLAACDWMQCQAQPRHSPVHGEKLGSVNRDGSVYSTKSEALAQCAADMITLARAVYGIDLTVPRPMSVRALAEVFATFRWGGLLKKHGVSAMEFPYSVAGLTEYHTKMHWPAIHDLNAPDKPGGKFKQPFGAVPVVLSLKYPATV
jgi:flagellum-specific peptidoglycan hydrolase FlgJ